MTHVNETNIVYLQEEKDVSDDEVPDLVPSDTEIKVWKFWCHACEELLDIDPKLRVDGSLECFKCKENLVERIAEDDQFLLQRMAEMKMEEKTQEELSPNSRFSEIIRDLENMSDSNSPYQFHVIRRDARRVRTGEPRSRSVPRPARSNRQAGRRNNPLFVLFSDILLRNERRPNRPEQEESENRISQILHQLNRMFRGGMPGAALEGGRELNFGMILQDILGLEDVGSFGGQRLDPSDFGFGFNGFMDILSRLQREGGQSGPPPASKKIVEGLKEFEFRGDQKEPEKCACAVCKDDFKEGDKIIQFPCPSKHPYHRECIHPWLKLHNSCPVCRHELVTDDDWYEKMKQFRTNMNTESESGPSGGSDPPPAPGSSGAV